MGILCATGSLCFFVALRDTTAANVSQLHYTQLITGALMAWLVWHQVPGLDTMLGAVLIIASGLYIAALAAQDHRSFWISPPVHPD
jgi:drug/metabolite transporter (DMT)-like permease